MLEGEFVRIGVSDASGGSSEIDIPAVAQAALQAQGYAVQRSVDDLVLNGFLISPRMLALAEANGGGFRTTCAVRFSHPDLFPDGAFEFQHAVGDTPVDSLRSGFDQWSQMDVPTLIDALADTPEMCTYMDMEWPAGDGGAAQKRRVVLGPVAHLAAKSDPNAPSGDACEEHSFCPCCLTTNSMDAFTDLFKSDGTYALRLFAMRDESGAPNADCRVNGEEFEPGKEALRKYVTSWPDRGFEFRKQYVVIRSV